MCFDHDSAPPVPRISGAAVSHEDVVLEAADGNRFAAFVATPDEPTGVVAIIATACGGSQATQAPAASASPGTSTEPGASPSAGEGNLAADQTLRLYLAPGDPRSPCSRSTTSPSSTPASTSRRATSGWP